MYANIVRQKDKSKQTVLQMLKHIFVFVRLKVICQWYPCVV